MSKNQNIPGIAFLTCGDGKRIGGEIIASSPISGFFNSGEIKAKHTNGRYNMRKNRGGKSQWLIY